MLGHEHVTVRKIGGILLTMSGVALALGDKILGAGSLAGELTILASAAIGAVCSVLYRPYLRRYPTLPVSAFAMAAAAVALFPFAALDDLFVAPAQLSLSRLGRDRIHRALVRHASMWCGSGR